MSDPLLDENLIIHMLNAPMVEEYTGTIQSGAIQSLVDMFDRKVTREFFIDHATSCFALYGQASRMSMLRAVERAFDSGKLTTEEFKTARDRISEIMRKQSETVITIVQQLQACPTSQDSIH